MPHLVNEILPEQR